MPGRRPWAISIVVKAEHGVAEGDEVDVGAEAGDHAAGLELVQAGLDGAPGDAQAPRQLQHAEAGRRRQLGDQPAVDVVQHLHVDSLPNSMPSVWSICPTRLGAVDVLVRSVVR